MSDRWESTTGGYSFRFFSPEQADEILRDGARRGREGSHAAIERILKVEPGLERAQLWQRLRRLKFPANEARYHRVLWSSEDDQILSRGYARGWSGKRDAVRDLLRRHPDWRPHVIWKRAAKLHLTRNVPKPRQDRSHSVWSEHDNQLLLNLAGYKAARSIARMLRRSEAAVRYHLMLLGKSSRVDLDGFSRHGLAADLHLGKKTVQRLIVDGLLEVRDPRITRESVDRLRKSGGFGTARLDEAHGSVCTTSALDCEGPPATNNPTPSIGPSGKSSRAQRVWLEAANSFGVSLDAIKQLIANRVLGLYDPTVTEKSLRSFCRHYGSLINYEFLNRETKDWLQTSMDLVRSAGESTSGPLLPLRKHARIVRECEKCGHKIRGNVFFSHIKKCGRKEAESSQGKKAMRRLV